MASEQFENEHDLWRWYTTHLSNITNPTSFNALFKNFDKIDTRQLIANIKKIFTPKSNIQTGGGGTFTQEDYKSSVYYNYRLDSYNDLLTYLTKNDIHITKLTRYILQKMYLYHYTLDYIKALNHILVKLNEFELPITIKQTISDVFTQISIEIYNTLTN